MVPAPPPLVRDPLLLPVGSSSLALDPSFESSSLARAAERLVEEEIPLIPVLDELGRFVGIITEANIRQALAAGAEPSAPIGDWMTRDPHVLPPSARGAEALRLFDLVQASHICLIDSAGQFHGVLTPSRLMSPPAPRPRPRMVGGMATPLGVYLTDGRVGAGVPHLALILTGGLLFSLFLGSSLIVQTLTNVALLQKWVTPVLIQSGWFQAISSGIALALFFIGMRSLPLAGIHAAEHMVVHAIERGEPLEPDIVSRMPRVHPRCGTNIAVGAMLFLGIFNLSWPKDQELRLLAAAIVTLVLWRNLGYLLQDKITTKPANAKQIQMGIKAGTELMHKIDMEPHKPATPLQRIVSSGILQVIGGSFIAQMIVWGAMELLRVPAFWRPF